jgi:hypothetical protein
MIEIKLATPEIEILTVGYDNSGKSATIRVGFKRHKRKAAIFLISLLSAGDDATKVEDALKKRPSGKFFEKFHVDMEEEDILRLNITYLAGLEVAIDGQITKIDTRKNLPENTTFEDFLDLYLDNTTFFPAIVDSFLRSLNSYNYEAAKRANLKK